MREYLKKLLFPLIVSNFLFPLIVVAWFSGLGETGIFKLYLLSFAAAFIGYLVCVLFNRIHVIFQLILDIILSAAFAYLLFGNDLLPFILGGLVIFIMVFITNLLVNQDFLSVVKTKYLALVIVVYFIVQLGIEFSNRMNNHTMDALKPYLLIIGVLWLLFTVFTTNRLTIAKSAYMAGENGPPTTVKRGNRYMILVYVGVTTIFIFFNVLAGFVKRIYDLILDGLTYIFHMLNKLFQMGPDPTPMTPESDEMQLPEVAEVVERSPFWDTVGRILLGAVLVIIALLLLFLIVKGIIALYKKIKKALSVFIDDWQNSKSYFDEEEQLFSWDKVREDTRAGLENFRKRFKRRVRLDTLPDNKAKVRILYKWILQKTYKQDPNVLTKTPNEYLDYKLQGLENSDDFIEAYNKARFGKKDIENNIIDIGKSINKKV